MPTQIMVAEGIMDTSGAEPRLIGSKCQDCDTHAFPAQGSCQRCSGTNVTTTALSNTGVLWTFTIQGFPPKAPPYKGNADPATFKPFGVGYVELPGQVKVETRITEADPKKLKIGMEMKLVLDVLGEDADGNDLVTFAFSPTGN